MPATSRNLVLTRSSLIRESIERARDSCALGSKECEQAAVAVMQAAQDIGARAQRTDFKQAR
jgi:hypothetical protein